MADARTSPGLPADQPLAVDEQAQLEKDFADVKEILGS
jgi:hypothetical protein